MASLEKEVARLSRDGGLIYQSAFRLRHTSSVSQARHLLLEEKVNFYCQHCDFERANAVRPYDVDFAFAIILRDAEDVIPCD